MSETKDGVENVPSKTTDAGESAGGAYPNPHTGKKPEGGGFMGHGGQTEIAYSGTGQGGQDDDPEVGNVNAVTKDD
ncbi:hypothetical protein [Sphingomonas sp.]|jgi:hypothetical protein|uniref:hypothetical protein n=1 Tax=Sphingomonas sp. TaxID=28214 RepID=UPI002D7F7A74|nr:hypothetical protein [Sphingomonas sp.]HEU0043357.1 hypothetical protein [Sphingomonas sp.]